VIGFGYRDGLWTDAPTRAVLDAVSGDVPVVLVAADLHACWLNSAALRRHGVEALAGQSGLLREDDCFRLVREIDDVADDVLDGWVADAAARAAARGIVGIVDYEMRWNLDDWARRAASGAGPLRVAFGIYTQHLDRAIAEGLRTGDAVPGTGGLVTVGGYKVITDGSLNTRTACCDDPYPGLTGAYACGVLLVAPDELLPLLQRAAAHGIDAAVHAIGDRANALVLDAFAALPTLPATGRRIEHAQLLRDVDPGRFAELGVVASVQPAHVLDDRDVADRLWAGRTGRAFPYRTLLDAGADIVLGSDAPVAPLDPWITIAAAVHRSSDDRPSWHPEQEIPLPVALAASTGPDGPVRVGRRADLCVTDLDPAAVPAAALSTMPVAGTLLGGRWTHRAGI
jgi:predicted amidohydrolase YtcJ